MTTSLFSDEDFSVCPTTRESILSSLDALKWVEVAEIKSVCPLGCVYEYKDNLSWLK